MQPAATPTDRFIAHHRAAAMATIKKARAHRAWLRKRSGQNHGLAQFYGEHLDLVMADVRRARKFIREGKARLAAQASALKAAA